MQPEKHSKWTNHISTKLVSAMTEELGYRLKPYIKTYCRVVSSLSYIGRKEERKLLKLWFILSAIIATKKKSDTIETGGGESTKGPHSDLW